MHPSFSRLLTCAREATKDSPTPIKSVRDLRTRMDESSATFTNWQSAERGVSLQGALKAQDLFGCHYKYILDNIEPRWVVLMNERDPSMHRASIEASLNQAKQNMSPWAVGLSALLDSISDPETQMKAYVAAMELIMEFKRKQA